MNHATPTATTEPADADTAPAWVVLTGNPIDGFTLHGPFRTSDHASGYARAFLDELTIAPLRHPNDENDAPDEDWSGYGGAP